jgi:PhzF family phenazine biosynthesis protein
MRRSLSMVAAGTLPGSSWMPEASMAWTCKPVRLLWFPEDLDPGYPVRPSNAGSEHLILVAKTRKRLADLDYDFDVLAELMRDHGLITVQLVWPESSKRYHSRNPFAGSGVVEDPATGASAAAFGGYLRELGLIETASLRSSRA